MIPVEDMKVTFSSPYNKNLSLGPPDNMLDDDISTFGHTGRRQKETEYILVKLDKPRVISEVSVINRAINVEIFSRLNGAVVSITSTTGTIAECGAFILGDKPTYDVQRVKCGGTDFVNEVEITSAMVHNHLNIAELRLCYSVFYSSGKILRFNEI